MTNVQQNDPYLTPTWPWDGLLMSLCTYDYNEFHVITVKHDCNKFAVVFITIICTSEIVTDEKFDKYGQNWHETAILDSEPRDNFFLYASKWLWYTIFKVWSLRNNNFRAVAGSVENAISNFMKLRIIYCGVKREILEYDLRLTFDLSLTSLICIEWNHLCTSR